MHRNYEIANFDTRMPLRCMMRRVGVIEEHMHEHFEVDLILSGRCNVITGGQTYQLNPEDGITVDSHMSHEFRENDCVMIRVQFEQALFEQTLPDPLHPRFFCNRHAFVQAFKKRIRRKAQRVPPSEPDTGQELKTLEALSTPIRSKYIAEAKKKTLEIDAILDMMEVRLITIEPMR